MRKGQVGKLVWAEDEERKQEVGQRKPTPGRTRVNTAHPVASWFLAP